MSVQVLPQSVVDMIAAGEVIERPASIVKELIENALDAGASRVEVRVENGGKDRITVTDDGTGMDSEDLALAVLSHATSKLLTPDDLFRVTTFGFRGEALPSIGAVSMMEIRTRIRARTDGSVIRVSAGKIEGPLPEGCPPGTTVDVKNLFFNAQVRRKFLKNTPAEMYHVSSQVMNMAIARPDAAFSLIHGQRTVWRLEPVADLKDRIEAFFGKRLAADLVPLSYTEVGLTITGFVAPPPHCRSNRNSIFTYINGRFVREKILLHAVSESFREFLTQGRHPIAFVFITVDPAEVDVNVHPTKLEVRFRRSGQMHGILSALFRKSIERGAGAVKVPVADHGLFPAPEVPESPDARDFLDGAAPGSEGSWRPLDGSAPLQSSMRPFDSRGSADRTAVRAACDPRFMAPASAGAGETEAAEIPHPTGPAPQSDRAMQVHDSYIVAETADGIEIIDQHALHERVLYDEIMGRMTAEGLSTQKLLIPITIDLDPSAEAVLGDAAELLLRFGLEIESFGPGSVAVHGIPPLLPDSEVEGFIGDVVEEFSGREGAGSASKRIEAVAKRLACRSAVKAGQLLTRGKVLSIVEKAAAIRGVPTCPHGRPAVLRITIKDLERHFRRT